MNVFSRVMPMAAVMALTFGCEGTPLPSDPSAPSTSETSDIRLPEGQSCEAACAQVIGCLRGGHGYGQGGYGSYGSGGYAECGYAGSPDWCGYGGYGDGYGGYGNLPGYGGYGDGYGGYGEGYGDGAGGYGCGAGGYGDGYGDGYGYGYDYGSSMYGQCVAGCRALPMGARRHVIACVMSARNCQVRLACE